MLYYDDRDYLNYEDIDDLYDEDIEIDTDTNEYHNEHEFDCYYHKIADELIDD